MPDNPTMQIANPGAVPVTLTYTLTLDQWRDLSSKLSAAWQGSDLAAAIASMVSKASAQFTP